MSCLSVFVFLLFGVSCVYPVELNIAKNPESYRNFLIASVNGKATPPLNKVLAEKQNLWERSGKFEGDIVLTPEQIESRVNDVSGMNNAILNTARLWTNKVVRYVISSSFTAAQKTMIKAAMNDISNSSCVKFRQRLFSKNYISIVGNNTGCYSSIGMVQGAQILNLEAGCFVHGIIVHELLHSLGFYHMQSTHNRDDWVSINWAKILAGKENNFIKYSVNEVTNFNVTYDYGSVLHYSQYAFSIDGNKTITPLQATNATIGQRVAMSAGDKMKLNKLYSCKGYV